MQRADAIRFSNTAALETASRAIASSAFNYAAFKASLSGYISIKDDCALERVYRRISTTFPGLVRILLFRCRKAVKNGIENLYSRSDCDSFVTDIDRVVFIFYNTEKER